MLQISPTTAIGLHAIAYIHVDHLDANLQKATIMLASGKVVTADLEAGKVDLEKLFKDARVPCVVYDMNHALVLIGSRYIQELVERPNGEIEIRVNGDGGYVFKEAGNMKTHIDAITSSFTE